MDYIEKENFVFCKKNYKSSRNTVKFPRILENSIRPFFFVECLTFFNIFFISVRFQHHYHHHFTKYFYYILLILAKKKIIHVKMQFCMDSKTIKFILFPLKLYRWWWIILLLLSQKRELNLWRKKKFIENQISFKKKIFIVLCCIRSISDFLFYYRHWRYQVKFNFFNSMLIATEQ